MSWLNELEKLSNLKHPIFQGPLDIFQTQTARLIPQQALWGTGLGLHPKPLHTWGWFSWRKAQTWPWSADKNGRKEWDTHEWKRKIRVRHIGEEKGCVAKRKIRRQLSAHMCVPILTFTVLEPRFPFWKDKKGESQVKKWLTFPEIQICNGLMTFSSWRTQTVSTWFPCKPISPPHQECSHLMLHASVFMHHFCNGSCFGAPPGFLFDFNIVNNNLDNQEGKLHPAGGKTGPLLAVPAWLCAVSGYIIRTNALEKSSCLDRCCLIWLYSSLFVMHISHCWDLYASIYFDTSAEVMLH